MFTKDDVSRFRHVNGEDVALTDVERQATADEWNANAAERATRQAEEEARAAIREALKVEALADVFIDKLRGATPLEIKDYVQANVTDLPSAKAFIGRLACAVAYALNGGEGK